MNLRERAIGELERGRRTKANLALMNFRARLRDVFGITTDADDYCFDACWKVEVEGVEFTWLDETVKVRGKDGSLHNVKTIVDLGELFEKELI